MNDKIKTEQPNEAHINPSELNTGLRANLSAKVQNVKNLFEEWLTKQMGDHVKKYFVEFHNDDGYSDQVINAMWLGFCAGYVIRG